MSAITTKITPPPKVAGRFNVDFIETADKFLNQLPDMSVQMNNFANQANIVHDEMNTYREYTTNYKNKAYAYAQEAQKASNDIKNYVIPNGTTYDLEALETALNDLLTQNVAQQLQLNIMKDNVDIKALQNNITDLKENIIPQAADAVSPFVLAVNITPAVSTTTTGIITNYKKGDTYSIYIGDTSIVSDATVDTNNIKNIDGLGEVATFGYVTTSTAGSTSIIITRIRNGYKSQAVINITSH